MATTSRSPRRPGCTPSARCTGCPYFRDAKVYFKGEGADERRVQAIGNDRYEARYVGPQGEERLVWSSASERRRQDRVAERQIDGLHNAHNAAKSNINDKAKNSGIGYAGGRLVLL